MKLKLLLDANIVIQSYEIGLWDELVRRTTIMVSSIVAHTEALFYSSDLKGIPTAIDLPRLVCDGKITEISASLQEMSDLNRVFDPVALQGLDPGETEALALIHVGKVSEHLFCSADAAAVQALAMLGHSDLGISMEEVLQRIGFQKQLPDHFSREFFRRNVAIGQQRRITGQGLR